MESCFFWRPHESRADGWDRPQLLQAHRCYARTRPGRRMEKVEIQGLVTPQPEYDPPDHDLEKDT